MPKKPRRLKHVPQRTCIGCREVLPKRSLIRIVRTQKGIQIDPSGKLSGRGAYLHNRWSCWERGLNEALSRALKTELTAEDKVRLVEYMESLPEDSSPPGEPDNEHV